MYRPWYNGGITLRKLWNIINRKPVVGNSEHFQINKEKKPPVDRVIIYGAGKAGNAYSMNIIMMKSTILLHGLILIVKNIQNRDCQ